MNQETDIKILRKRLKEILLQNSLKIAPPHKPFVLASGRTSTYYIDGKKTTSDPEGLYCIAKLILDIIQNDDVQAIGGPTLGADPIVGGVSLLSFISKTPLSLFIVRKEAKNHGTQNMIEGADISGKRVIVVEDVITTGGSALKAIKAIQAHDAGIVRMISLVDREQGGSECFDGLGIPYHPLFTISELLPHPA